MTEKPSARKERFEDHLKVVEDVVKALESGKLGLEESMDRYESGRAALAKCYAILEQAEKKIELLVKQGDGSLKGETFETGEKPAPKKKKTADDDVPF